MIPKLPWWHRMLMPYFNWRADRRAKREADRWVLIGYFRWKDEKRYALAAYKRPGKRKIVYMGPSIYRQIYSPHEDLHVAAWLAGDDKMEQFLQDMPSHEHEARK